MENNASYSKVPVKVGFWGNVKTFWFQPITLELNQKEKNFFKSIHDFWNQEVYVEKGEVKLRKPEATEKADTVANVAEVNVAL